jgi:hypothetical protein
MFHLEKLAIMVVDEVAYMDAFMMAAIQAMRQELTLAMIALVTYLSFSFVTSASSHL